MATLLQTRNLVRNDITQTDASTSDFADSELNQFIDQGVRFLGALVKKPLKRASFAAVLDTSTYAIATVAPDLVILTKAYFGDPSINGDVRTLRIIPEEELAELAPGWLETNVSSQGTPRYMVRDGANLLIFPRPNAAQSASGKTIYISYVYQPASLSSDSTNLDLPIIYHDLVAKYAVAMCYFGKLNNNDKGTELKSQVIIDAKKMENLIVKDSESPGFYWGTTINPDDDLSGLKYW